MNSDIIQLNKPTLCLNMIVKNESKIITRLFDSVLPLIDCYCICDTGSTDDTINIIRNYFTEKNIPGKIVEEPFVSFGYNRSLALKYCADMSDYALLIDADMILRISDTFDKSMLTADYYQVFQGSDSYYYQNTRIVKNNGLYSYIGATHEYLNAPPNSSKSSLNKDELFINDVGDGGAKHDKFERDIRLLTQGILEEPNNTRYYFYLGNSYRDSGQNAEAIEPYLKVLELDAWGQEKYCSCLRIGYSYKNLNEDYLALRYWIKSSEYDSERIEGIVEAMEYLRANGDNVGVNRLYHKFKNYNNTISSSKLFVDRTKYDDLIEYNNSICAFYTNDKQSGYECCKKIIMNNIISSDKMNMTLSNIMFYKEYMEKDTDKTM